MLTVALAVGSGTEEETVALTSLIESVLGTDLPIALRAYDGTALGPSDAPATVILRTPNALRRIVTAPGELGFARAYVAGDLDVDGDMFAALELRDRLPDVKLTPKQLVAAAREVGLRKLRPLPPPPEEARLHGRRHSVARDRAAVSHHYDVSNDFYRIILGPSLTYSCAVFTDDDTTLEQAQANKYELVARKLDLPIAGGDVVIQREHSDRRLANREGWGGNHRGQ